MRCEMCGRKASETITIKNRKNGSELKICRKCASHYGFTSQKGRKNEKDKRNV